MKNMKRIAAVLLLLAAGCAGKRAVPDPMRVHVLAEPAEVTIWVQIDGSQKLSQSVVFPAGTVVVSRELWYIANDKKGDE